MPWARRNVNLSQKLLNRECDNLLNEIKRLESDLNMQKQRLKNVMALVSYITLSVKLF